MQSCKMPTVLFRLGFVNKVLQLPFQCNCSRHKLSKYIWLIVTIFAYWRWLCFILDGNSNWPNRTFWPASDTYATCKLYGEMSHNMLINIYEDSGCHYNDVIMSATASQITGVSIVYIIVSSGADQRKHPCSASLAFVWGIHRWPVNSRTKGQ